MGSSYPVAKIRRDVLRVLEAPLADVEALETLTDQFIGVEGWIPCFEVDVAKDDAPHVKVGILAGSVDGYAIGILRSGGGRHGAHR